MIKHYVILIVMVTVAVLSTACSGSTELSPTSASALTNSPASSGATTTSGNPVSSTTQQNSNNEQNQSGQQNSNGEHHELQGLVAGLSGSCPNLVFTVDGASVTTNGSTTFEDGPCSGIQNGTRVEVKGTKQPNGSVLAGEVETENGHSEVELKGDVAGIGGACPNLTFTVNGTGVTTNSSTDFEDGPCSGVQNGTRVEVKGLKQPNGSVLASDVETDDVKLEGVVAGLSGACPGLTFTVNGTAVTTNASTKFEDGPCGAVQNGMDVEVKGLKQPNGSVVARKVEIEDDDDHDHEVELKGSISALSGACPALTFAVHGRTVTTNTSTKFEDESCGSIHNGTDVEVKGVLQSDDKVLARKVELEDHD